MVETNIAGVEFTETEMDNIQAAVEEVADFNGSQAEVKGEYVEVGTVSVKADNDSDGYVRIIPHDERGMVYADLNDYIDFEDPNAEPDYVEEARDIIPETNHFREDAFSVVDTGDSGSDDHDFLVAMDDQTSVNEEPLATLMDTFSLSYVNTRDESYKNYTDEDLGDVGVVFYFGVDDDNDLGELFE